MPDASGHRSPSRGDRTGDPTQDSLESQHWRGAWQSPPRPHPTANTAAFARLFTLTSICSYLNNKTFVDIIAAARGASSARRAIFPWQGTVRMARRGDIFRG